eukprot:gene13829-16306_t
MDVLYNVHTHLLTSMNQSFVEWPVATQTNFLNGIGIYWQLTNQELLRIFLLFVVLPILSYQVISVLVLRYLYSIPSMKQHTNEMVASGAIFECVQRFTRAFYAIYFVYSNAPGWIDAASFPLERSLYLCLAYALYHLADIVVLLMYKSKTFGKNANYAYFSAVLASIAIFFLYRFPCGFWLLANGWRFGLQGLIVSIGPATIVYLDLKWSRGLIRIVGSTWQRLKKNKTA